MIRFYLLTFFFSISLPEFLGQNENNVWYFGENAGVDFNTNPPTAISGSLNSLEGNSSICDPSGNILFYTDGNIVWDKNGGIMPNGTGLLGDLSSTQSSIIIPVHNSCSRFYIFTTEDHEGDGRFAYSIVDMCLNNGLGDVEGNNKNIVLADNISEKLTVVKHQNGIDFWVVTHELNSNNFLVFLVNELGVQAPLITPIGSVHTTYIGPVKSNHAGNKLVTSVSFASKCEMFDFDNNTGVISNFVNLQNQYSFPQGIYGIEFSTNDQFLYLSAFWGTSRLYQINLTDMSIVTVATAPGNYNFGFLQMGPDDKIYMGRNNQNYISVINNPNVQGVGCDFQSIGITLLPGTQSFIGLHNMTPNNFFTVSSASLTLGEDIVTCESDEINLHLQPHTSNCPVQLTWPDNSTNDTLSINQSGTYWVEINNGCFSFVDTIHVQLGVSPNLELIEDTTICSSSTYEISATHANATSYLWNDGSTASSLIVSSSGLYWVTASSSCGSDTDSIFVDFQEFNFSSLGNDTLLCDGANLTIDVEANGASILWNTGSVEESIQVSSSGIVWVQLSAQNCVFTDSLQVTFIEPTMFDLGNDTLVCSFQPIVLDPSLENVTFLWSDGSSSPILNVDSNGDYWLEIFNGACYSSDTIVINFSEPVSVFLGNDTILCEPAPLVLTANSPTSNVTFLWNDGSSTSSIQALNPGVYWVQASNGICQASDSIEIALETPAVMNLSLFGDYCLSGSGQIIVNGVDGLSGPYAFSLNSGPFSSINQFDNLNSDSYYLQMISVNGCTYDTTIFISSESTTDLEPVYSVQGYSCLHSPLFTINDVQGGFSPYEFSFNSASNFSSSNTFNFTPNESFIVWIKDSLGCLNSYEYSFPSELEIESLYIPNCFTPDDDEANPRWFVKGNCIKDYECLIFNRWGNLMFEIYDINEQWDGTFKGKKVQDGVYFYKVNVTYFSGTSEEYHGHVSLLR